MRVSAGLAVEMVRAMVACPVVDRALVGYAVAQHENGAESEASSVAAVRPETVRTARDAECSDRPQRSGP